MKGIKGLVYYRYFVLTKIIRSWLYAMCRGIEHDPVKPRPITKTLGCSKNFPGKTALSTRDQVGRHIPDRTLSLLRELVGRFW